MGVVKNCILNAVTTRQARELESSIVRIVRGGSSGRIVVPQFLIGKQARRIIIDDDDEIVIVVLIHKKQFPQNINLPAMMKRSPRIIPLEHALNPNEHNDGNKGESTQTTQ